jgi:mannose-6-phosphate isomerase-like protein (cupin superfamily)
VKLRSHDDYEALAAAARHSHAHSRSVASLTTRDIDLARLYGHAFRAHVIGAFHATRVALEAIAPGPGGEPWRRQAVHGLESLANQALDPIFPDFRAVVSTFHRYDHGIHEVLAALDSELDRSRDARLEPVRDRFCRAMEAITTSNGIAPTRDDQVPEQASFVVPNLGITIVPLVYGDRHCWDLAYLAGAASNVPRHLHRDGVEIHLGFGKLHGYTVLGDYQAEVTEGYAMPIPPQTPHGFFNTEGQPHFLPFIFGSVRLGGWGIVLDVEPQPAEMEDLEVVPARAAQMRGLVALDREIERAGASSANLRWTLVSTGATYRPHSGALLLSIARATRAGLNYPAGPFRIVAVVRGSAVVQIGQVTRELGAHDHIGIPAGMSASLRQQGDQPLVALDALLAERPT